MDTIVIILLCAIPVKADTVTNRFTDAFNKADKQFNKEHILDIRALKRASEKAASEAAQKTKYYLIKTK